MYVEPEEPLRVGKTTRLIIKLTDEKAGLYYFVFNPEDTPFYDGKWPVTAHAMVRGSAFEPEVTFDTDGPAELFYGPWGEFLPSGKRDLMVLPADEVESAAKVALVAAPPPTSEDEVLWKFIGSITDRMRFEKFRGFVDPKLIGATRTRWHGTSAYEDLRQEADTFVARAADPMSTTNAEFSSSTAIGALDRSYVSDEVGDLARPFYGHDPADTRPPATKFPLPNVPFVELIWNYWTEEGMLVQTLHHIVAKFQNRHPGPGRDALARFDLNPLLPLRSLLWGFAEDEQRRLTVRRRAAEYEYEYGLRLRGRAIPPVSTVAERRSQFLEAFHSLLHSCYLYYKERDDKTIEADAFPLLSSLREVHLVLARGAHNQFANLAVTARAEMLTMQWMLAQPEMREFLGGPTMVPYEEPWMDRVDAMKTVQGWTDTSITHFFELATHGEQILLSVRHGRWNESSRTREDAENWALLWRNAIQRYIHAYRTVTGIDLATAVDATMPSELMARRLGLQRRRA